MAVGSEPKQTVSMKPNLLIVIKLLLELKIEGEAGGVEFKNNNHTPWPVAQLVRVSSRYAKVASSIPGQGSYKNPPRNA